MVLALAIGQLSEGSGRQPVDAAKPFKISSGGVWEAFKRVKANHGVPGVDGQSIAEFEANLKGSLYLGIPTGLPTRQVCHRCGGQGPRALLGAF